MWCQHEKFLLAVEQSCGENIDSTKQFSLCRKLKLLKGPLKVLNKKHFAGRDELMEAQKLLHDNFGDENLKVLVKNLLQTVGFLCEAKRRFLLKKLSVVFFCKVINVLNSFILLLKEIQRGT